MSRNSIQSISSPLLDKAKNIAAHHALSLEVGENALLSRIHLIRAATESILLQTFIWAPDETGRYFTYELLQAAKRGVQVRLIIDAWMTERVCHLMHFLAVVHPNIQVRFYNPPAERLAPRIVGLAEQAATDFDKLNHRMHNKTFIIDEAVAIVGGRNYENTYYDRSTLLNFRDRDILVTGPIVSEIVQSFEQYWDSELSFRVDELIDYFEHEDKAKLCVESVRDEFELNDLFDELDRKASSAEAIEQILVSELQPVQRLEFVADPPPRGAPWKTDPHSRERLLEFLREPYEQLYLQSPYFILNEEIETLFTELQRARPGLEILVSTNSLAATDNVVAYAYSMRERPRYLELGLRLFEFRPQPDQMAEMMGFSHPEAEFSNGGSRPYKRCHLCVHAKTYIVDSRAVFISSSNIDPRSLYLNSECGVIVYDEAFTERQRQAFEVDIHPRNSWTVGKSETGMSEMWRNLFGSDLLGPGCENYDLKEGAKIRPFTDPNFTESYSAVGRFPEADGSVREIEARLIAALGGAGKELA